AEHEGGVAPETRALRARQRGAAEHRAIAFLIECQHLRGPRRRSWRERGLPRGRRLRVPRTHLLANVAAEQPVAQLRPELFGDRAGMLDGEIRDAPPGIEHVGVGEGLRRTGVQTRATRPATVRLLISWLELGRGEDDPDEEVRAEIRREQIRVPADPPEPGG